MNVVDKLKGINLNEIQDETLKSKVQKTIEFFADANDLSVQENKVLLKIFNQAEKAITKKKQPPKYNRNAILSEKDIDNLSEEDCRKMLKERARIRFIAKSRIEKREKSPISHQRGGGSN